ncbi:MAG: 4Fe-4S binding protein [Ruminococcus sp.]|nr:4Fe-4S binding protein [Ruminococcus sp.]
MTAESYLRFIVDEIHSTVVATVDEDGLPVTCVIDMMYADGDGLCFLTAKGKSFYRRLTARGYIALSGKKGENTMSCTAVSVRGRVRELGAEMLPLLFERNPYMRDIYPTEDSRRALTVFQLYEGSGEWFDLSKKPIERDSFSFGGAESRVGGYFVTEDCIGCGTCLGDCPQSCIDMVGGRAVIRQQNCLHCGNCAAVCPAGAVKTG